MCIDKSRCPSPAIISRAILRKFTGFTSVVVPSKNIYFLHSGTRYSSLVLTTSPVSQVPVMSPLSQVSVKQLDDTKDLRTRNGDFSSAGGITLALDAWPHIYKDQLDPYNSQSPLWKVTPLCSTAEKSERGILSYCKVFLCHSSRKKVTLLEGNMRFKLVFCKVWLCSVLVGQFRFIEFNWGKILICNLLHNRSVTTCLSPSVW